jgi:hypothetical protein
MNIRTRKLAARLNNLLWQKIRSRRAPDKTIYQKGVPYLHRWYLTPWRRWYTDDNQTPATFKGRVLKAIARALPNVYLHVFVAGDSDQALHDHPWWSCSITLDGHYRDIHGTGCFQNRMVGAGDWVFRKASNPHRIELNGDICTTLFITGPAFRQWGFHCKTGWVHWQKYLKGGCPQ